MCFGLRSRYRKHRLEAAKRELADLSRGIDRELEAINRQAAQRQTEINRRYREAKADAKARTDL